MLLAAAIAAAGFSPPVAASERVLRLSDRRVLPLEAVADDLLAARIIFVGEAHGQRPHHEAQVEVARVLEGRGAAVSLGLEAFRAESQVDLDDWVAGRTTLDAFVGIYYRNWSYPWTVYEPVFLHARDRRLPLVGLNIPEGLVRRVSREGPSALDDETAAAVGGIACVVDDSYRAFMRRAASGYAEDPEAFERFCSAQVFWDAAMAVRVMRYLERNAGRTMVVFAGKGHAWKPGIPAQVRRRGGPESRVILPAMPGLVDPDTATTADADYVILF